METGGDSWKSLVRLGASALLLGGGFAAILVAYYVYARSADVVGAERARVLVLGLWLYFRLVFFKGLLPQLVLAFGLRRLAMSGRGGLAADALAAGIAYAVVAPLLLTVDFESWPALQLREPMHHVSTAVLMIGAVAAALWLPGALRRPAARSGSHP